MSFLTETIEVMKEINWIFILPLLVMMFMIVRVINTRLQYAKIKREFIRQKPILEGMEWLVKLFRKHKKTKLLLDDFTRKVSCFNSYSIEINNRIAALAMGLSSAVAVLALVIYLPTAKVWYLGLFGGAVILGVVGMLYYLFTIIVLSMLLSKLPDTFKILNARYISHGNILKAIQVSMPDFSSVIKREMKRIYDSLQNNDMRQVERTFNSIEKTYNDEYLTILLQLIWQAHFKGGSDVVKEQFEEVTEDVLMELENRKDISSATRSYIVLGFLIIPPTMFLTEQFTKSALLLEENASDFFSSPVGIGFKILIILLLLLFSGVLLFMEKTD